VLTQSTYQLQRWLDWLESRPDVTVVAWASREGLVQTSPEAFAGRGPWAGIELMPLDGDDDRTAAHPSSPLGNAFAADVSARLAAVEQAAAVEPSSPALHLAVASVRMEVDDLPQAQQAIERATALAPDWEAVAFEHGKLWLRGDDLERAAQQFARAAELMPTFSAALSNLGAALAETDRPDEAVAALRAALATDPNGYTVLNNLSVLYREQGRLDEAVTAALRVQALAPGFVFGYYNLAHTLFLMGRFEEARRQYEDGQSRDPQKNAVQWCRLAMARAAEGDVNGALRDLDAAADRLPPTSRAEVLDEVEEVLAAISGLDEPRAAALQPLRDLVAVKKKAGR
jgi:Flp pilus assembly protein TadD